MIYEAELTTAEKMILFAINDHVRAEHPWAFPSQTTLAIYTSLSKRHVIRTLAGLKERGVIEIKQRGKGKKYRIFWEQLVTSCHLNQKQQVTPSHPTGDTLSLGRVTPCHPEEHVEKQKNKHADVASKKQNGWTGNITLSELQDSSKIDQRFQEAVTKNYCTENNRVCFHALAMEVAGKAAKSHGALFTSRLKKSQWSEDAELRKQAKQNISQLNGTSNEFATKIEKAMATA